MSNTLYCSYRSRKSVHGKEETERSLQIWKLYFAYKNSISTNCIINLRKLPIINNSASKINAWTQSWSSRSRRNVTQRSPAGAGREPPRDSFLLFFPPVNKRNLQMNERIHTLCSRSENRYINECFIFVAVETWRTAQQLYNCPAFDKWRRPFERTW